MRSHVTSISDCLSDSSFSFNTASGMRSHVTRKCRLAVGARSSFNTASGMRSHVTCGRRVSTYNDSSRFNTASGMRSHVTWNWRRLSTRKAMFQYRKRYEVTCDSVSGRPQKQKAQIMVLENLLETERAIALFRLSLHTSRVCNDPVKPYIARIAAIRGKSENLPRFFASGRFSNFYCTMLFHICQTSPRRKIAGRR